MSEPEVDAGTGDGPVDGTGSAPTDDEGTSGEAAPLPLDQAFDVLRNERRRRVLAHLLENDGWATMSELAEHVAAHETGKPVEELSSSERKRVYVALYQCHLPKMDDVDVVDFNKPRGIIELGPNAAALDRYLENAQRIETTEQTETSAASEPVESVGESDTALPSDGERAAERPWPWYYGALTLVGSLLAVLSLVVGAPSMQLLLGSLLLGFAGLSLVHLRASDRPLPTGEASATDPAAD